MWHTYRTGISHHLVHDRPDRAGLSGDWSRRSPRCCFPHRRTVQLVTVDGKVVGSELIGQNFTRPEYFHPGRRGGRRIRRGALERLELRPTNQKLADRVKASVEQYRQENPDYTGPIPADAVTASGSGLDPHITPANAEIQAARVARARGLDVGCSPADDGRTHRATVARLHRRAAGQCAEPECRAGRAMTT